MEEILAKLNISQKEAVLSAEGPVLVIAGAGSGKTRALTHRVAYLILVKKINPANILAVTFTNKAAQEMKERVASLLNSQAKKTERSFPERMPTIGTFHSICVRILRREIGKLGYKSSFNIFDDQDQELLMKKTIKELGLDVEQIKPRAVLGTISRAKNELISSKEFAVGALGHWEEMVGKIYARYQDKLKEQDGLDFDDILMLTIKLFQVYPEILEKYRRTFRYILVDEYQDTNHAQYVFVKMLSEKHRNICVVGDDWQGIYSWRGANIRNILDFEKDYPGAKVIKLEQNYRSTQIILDAAYGIISKNINRKDKKIWTENTSGQLIVSFEAENEKEEADFLVSKISEAHEKGENFSDFVVLYRTNAQSRIIEEALLKASLPYRIIGGVKFYQRKEIKDMLAYLRLIKNFSDEISLERIINEPRRGIGNVTLGNWLALAKAAGVNPIEAGLKSEIINSKSETNSNSKIQNSKLDPIIKFSDFIKRMAELKNKMRLTDFMQKIFIESGYEKYLLDGTEEGEMRHENIRELLTVAKKYDEYDGELRLGLFLEEVALSSETDNVDQNKPSVHLMTLHSAKGLEFETVFIVGLEEGILPHSRSFLSAEEMEEERRLMYVGVTRARKKVFLLFTRERNIFGSTQINIPSRFIGDIPEKLIENHDSDNFKDKKERRKSDFFEKNVKINFPDQKAVENFRDGDLIEHDFFGQGRIVASQGEVATVAFKGKGLKKISLKLAPVKKISSELSK